MGTTVPYARPVPKSKWTPPTEQVAARLRALRATHEEIATKQAAEKAELEALITDGVPVATLADLLGVDRKTIYRYTGRPMR